MKPHWVWWRLESPWEPARFSLIWLADVDQETVAQLVKPRYTKDTSGQIVVEPKEDVISRRKRSPDDVEALLLALYASAKSGPGRTAGNQIAAARIG